MISTQLSAYRLQTEYVQAPKDIEIKKHFASLSITQWMPDRDDNMDTMFHYETYKIDLMIEISTEERSYERKNESKL